MSLRAVGPWHGSCRSARAAPFSPLLCHLSRYATPVASRSLPLVTGVSCMEVLLMCVHLSVYVPSRACALSQVAPRESGAPALGEGGGQYCFSIRPRQASALWQASAYSGHPLLGRHPLVGRHSPMGMYPRFRGRIFALIRMRACLVRMGGGGGHPLLRGHPHLCRHSLVCGHPRLRRHPLVFGHHVVLGRSHQALFLFLSVTWLPPVAFHVRISQIFRRVKAATTPPRPAAPC
ncbi:hypothetical protein C2E23DRAFT_45854 [Lenzites betulinus]|nr:hypothetical protein C2E23DRAFT_45854 [Lenzites betulinus]